MMVTEDKARTANRFVEYQGKTYFFCNDGCKEEFQANPASFLKSASAAPGRFQTNATCAPAP